MVQKDLALNLKIIFRAGLALFVSAGFLASCSSMNLGGETASGKRVGVLTIEELQKIEEHKIAPEDELEVIVWGVPEFQAVQNSISGTNQAGLLYRVHADGSIDLPLIGKLSLGGLTVAEAKAAVEKEARRFVLDPKVSVTISRYGSRKILVLGEISNPGIVLNPGPELSLAEALAQAGGLDLTTANANHVYIIRGGLERPKVAHVSLDSAVGMFEAQHIWLKSRDVVYVDSKMITDWNRFVSQLLPTAGVAALMKTTGVIK